MAVKKFEDLLVWQKSQDLTLAVYKSFLASRDCSLRDQISRASVSISNNIAEGFDRKTNMDFVRFLYFARSSSGEMRSMLYLSERLNYLDTSKSEESIRDSNEISKMRYGLIKSIKK